MRTRLVPAILLSLGFALGRGDAASIREKAAPWSNVAAARYLDGRLAWWRSWPKADRDHGTKCISCHTALPYALARPALRKSLGEAGPSAAEEAMYADIAKRVRMWRDVEPFYPDQRVGIPKTSESRGTEAVLNALFLVARDNGSRGHLSDDARAAFANLWPLQMQTKDLNGSFPWLNFRLEPWEAPASIYWGATLAALAVARAPDNYAATPEIQPNVEALRGFLRTAMGSQSLFNRMLVLWADSNLHGILDPGQQQSIVDALLAAQGSDGGWSLTKLAAWQRIDGSALEDVSDGFASGIVTLVLAESGVSTHAKPLVAARSWLALHQDKETGGLPARSINKARAVGTDPYLFMTDGATGYAALAMLLK